MSFENVMIGFLKEGAKSTMLQLRSVVLEMWSLDR